MRHKVSNIPMISHWEFYMHPDPFRKMIVEWMEKHYTIQKIKVPMIDDISGLPWDRTSAFIDLRKRLMMLDLCDVQPDHVVQS